ncbi:hypothetical protein GUJ93_ZPchr0001g32380 [Zizania palustris]|uniref:Secreted protein n=1 Tax=Zizania palustris TaxID=103762 RepID=A0A8J5RMI2_ZIZPA|nr:hypothetical protein GUJ93_ZPchr0001g32380 [Zizania palustris]
MCLGLLCSKRLFFLLSGLRSTSPAAAAARKPWLETADGTMGGGPSLQKLPVGRRRVLTENPVAAEPLLRLASPQPKP